MKFCYECKKKLDKDTIGLNKKLLGRQTKQFMCLDCLSNFLDTSVDALIEKISYFKEQGCSLFL
jgi:uncharacterized protein YlaI